MKKIYLSPPHMSGKEIEYIKDVFKDNWIAPVGPHLNMFEEKVKEYTGSKHAVAVTSCTAGIHLALKALNVQEGDYVICSSLTFAATANPIIYCGAEPIFIDSEEGSWNMDPLLLETAILNSTALGKKPKAIIPVHIFGVPCNMDAIKKLSDEYDIPIIEDAAESLGSTFNDQHTGTFGPYGVYSFNGNKLLSTSGGGVIVTNDKDKADYMRFLSTQAKDKRSYYHHTEIGYNYRMSNVLAAIGLGQMEVIEDHIKRTREINQTYRDELGEYFWDFQNERDNDRSNMWLTCALMKGEYQPQDLIEHLANDSIEARRIWKPMHQQPIMSKYIKYINGTADTLFKQGICLPSGSNMDSKDMKRIIKSIKTFFDK
jgi:pyridoxal phosphate-dependent aminotransferase EpsN